MDIKELRKQYPDEASCRLFFESIIWSSGRTCPTLRERQVLGHRRPISP